MIYLAWRNLAQSKTQFLLGVGGVALALPGLSVRYDNSLRKGLTVTQIRGSVNELKKWRGHFSLLY
jgi:hypothetical protein